MALDYFDTNPIMFGCVSELNNSIVTNVMGLGAMTGSNKPKPTLKDISIDLAFLPPSSNYKIENSNSASARSTGTYEIGSLATHLH